MTAARIDFDRINAAALARLPSLCEQWLPAGRVDGHEYRVGNLRGDPGRSLSINLNTGVWKDFADDGIGGADVINLYAAIHGIGQADAARELGAMLGMDVPAPVGRRAERPAPKPLPPAEPAKPARASWSPLPVAPGPAPDDVLRHHQYGAPSRVWTYRDAAGAVIGHVCRFDMPDGGKEILPIAWAANGDRTAWRWLSFGKPRPLYGLDRLAAAPGAQVVVVEGEKAADALQALLPGAVVVTWPGGSSAVKYADWTPLTGRKIILWPDNDQAGFAAMMQLAKILGGEAGK